MPPLVASSPGRPSELPSPSERMHLQHGPIDLIVDAWGRPDHIQSSFDAARLRFETVLDELVGELESLRLPWSDKMSLSSQVARRMGRAVAPFGKDIFVTPMAAVAGAVADEMLDVLTGAAPLDKVYVNNGGDIAVYVAKGKTLTIGLVDEPDPGLGNKLITGKAVIHSGSRVAGVATSGRFGRSLSLGIADAVSVAAKNAASADVAATLIANAVNTNSPAIQRRPARDLDPDSDLGEMLVTVDVGRLTANEITSALTAGLALANMYCEKNLIVAASLRLHGASIAAGDHHINLPITDF